MGLERRAKEELLGAGEAIRADMAAVQQQLAAAVAELEQERSSSAAARKDESLALKHATSELQRTLSEVRTATRALHPVHPVPCTHDHCALHS